jgi:galactokinase
MSAREAAAKAALLSRCDQALAHRLGTTTTPLRMFVPGRVEFLGKHTDYAGGQSLICAIERGICASFIPLEKPELHIIDFDHGDEGVIPLSADAPGRDSHWSTYAAAVARRVTANFPGRLHGLSLAFASDLPIAAGLSSSSALVVMFFLALSSVNDLPRHPQYAGNIASSEDLAAYLGTIENGQSFKLLAGEKGVGTFGGSEDHTAILCGRPGCLSQYSFCPVKLHRIIPFPDDHCLLIASSGVSAEKTGAAKDSYNQTAARAEALLKLWQTNTGRTDASLAAALVSTSDARSTFDRIIHTSNHPVFSPDNLRQRLDQFILESYEIIPKVAGALTNGRLADVGALIDQSQQAAEHALYNQIKETIFLACSARELDAIAASAFGAGWGGSVWALAKSCESAEFLNRWHRQYVRSFPQHATASQFFNTLPGPPATLIQ